MRHVVKLLATGLGLGYSPVASGTAGTLLGVGLAVLLSGLPLWAQVGIVAAMVAGAVPICGAAEREFGRKDDGRIVADEYTTFPLCVLGLPWPEHVWLLGLAFLTHRALDVLKPPPARRAQDWHGGVGIVADDVVSSVYALLLNHAIWWAACRFLGAGSG